jgi:non-canonical purine NTP pyrophosphatase (RdgB/HAM1 family)
LNLHFATSNPNKLSELSELLEYRLTPLELDLQEIQTTDLQELVKHKLKQAYEHIHAPVIVEDTSLYFKAWNELPGPLVKWFIENLGLAGMVSALSQFKDKSAQAVCCLGYTNNG